MAAFIASVNARYGLHLGSYEQLHEWSVDVIPNFWSAVWEFAAIEPSQPYAEIVDDLYKSPGAKWFPGAPLNFAQNLMCGGTVIS